MSKMSVVVASLFFGCASLVACAAPVQEVGPADTGTTTSNLQVVGETSRCAGQPVASIGCPGKSHGYVRCLTNRTTGKSKWEVQCPSVCPVEGGGGGGGGPSTDPGTPGSPPSPGTGGGSGSAPDSPPSGGTGGGSGPSTNPGTPGPTPPPPAPPGYQNGTIVHENPADSKVGPAAGSGSDTKGPPPGTDPGAPPCIPSPTPVPPPPSNPSACAGLPVPEIGCRSGVPTPVCNADGGGRYHWSIACIEHPATPATRAKR